MKRTWELAFSESAYFSDLGAVMSVIRDWNYDCDTTDNADGDGDYIFEVYDENGDTVWYDGDGIHNLRANLPADCVAYLDQKFGKGKPRVIVGDAVKIPFPRSSHVRS